MEPNYQVARSISHMALYKAPLQLIKNNAHYPAKFGTMQPEDFQMCPQRLFYEVESLRLYRRFHYPAIKKFAG